MTENNIGSLYLVEWFSVLFGIYALLQNKHSKAKYFILAWVVLSPITGAMTYNSPDRPNTARVVYFYFILSLISAYGIAYLYELFKHPTRRLAVMGIVILFFLANGYFFYRQLILSDIKLSAVRSCGYKELLAFTESIKDGYEAIYIGKEYDYPYIQFLWYSKYDPRTYHQFIKNAPENVPVLIHTKTKDDWQLDKYIFTHDSCPMKIVENTLFVGNFRDCKDKKDTVVYKEIDGDNLLFVSSRGEVIYQSVAVIDRADKEIVFNVYTYDSQIDAKLTDKEKMKNYGI